MNLLVDTQFARAGFVFVGMRNPEGAESRGTVPERWGRRAAAGWNPFLTNPTVNSSSRYLEKFCVVGSCDSRRSLDGRLSSQGSLVKDHPQIVR